jgi:hypothetical protein
VRTPPVSPFFHFFHHDIAMGRAKGTHARAGPHGRCLLPRWSARMRATPPESPARRPFSTPKTLATPIKAKSSQPFPCSAAAWGKSPIRSRLPVYSLSTAAPLGFPSPIHLSRCREEGGRSWRARCSRSTAKETGCPLPPAPWAPSRERPAAVAVKE